MILNLDIYFKIIGTRVKYNIYINKDLLIVLVCKKNGIPIII